MKGSWLVIFICAAVIIAVSAWMFYYYRSEDYILYNEARELAANGDIYAAHEKITQALSINPKNRKVISLKTELYFAVQNDSAIKKAQKGKMEAERAMDRGDYAYAAAKLDEALAAINDVSTLYEKYSDAEKLQKALIVDVDRVVREAPEKYYTAGFELYNKGEYEKAYDTLDYIKKPSAKTVKLKDEIAYKIGCDKFSVIQKNAERNDYLVREAIAWLAKVSESSPNQIDAKMRIGQLKTYLK